MASVAMENRVGPAPESRADFASWFDDLPEESGVRLISKVRAFSHAEDLYDSLTGEQPNLSAGAGAIEVLKHHGWRGGRTALELGCGTGKLTIGIAARGRFERFVATDPSLQFLELTKRKAATAKLLNRLSLAVLMGEDFAKLPDESLDAIFLKATLHHIVDIQEFFDCASRKLTPGGYICMHEPCSGALMFGVISQFVEKLAIAEGVSLDEDTKAKYKVMKEGLCFYHRRDVDKSKAEDKYIFHPHEVLYKAMKSKIELNFIPNVEFGYFADGWRAPPKSLDFTEAMRGYLKYSSGFSETDLATFDQLLKPFTSYLNVASGGGSGPFVHGIFVGRKRRRAQPPR